MLAWLDDGVESHGERYLEMRRRLVCYFDRRNRTASDELADETFSRIARTLQEDGVIATRPPARYCYVVAKFVLLEDFRRERRETRLNASWHATVAASCVDAPADDMKRAQEHRLDCLDRCLGELQPQQRDLIVEYYAADARPRIERRRDMAARLGVTMNALAIRAYRIREALVACIDGCRRRPRQISRFPSYQDGREAR